MTTASGTSHPGTWPAEFAPIASQLELLGGRFRLARLVGGLARFMGFGIPLVLALLLLIGTIELPTWTKMTLLGLVTLTLLGLYWRYLHQTLFQRPTYGQIARWIEIRAQEIHQPLQNELINAVLLVQEHETHANRKIKVDGKETDNGTWLPAILRDIEQTLSQVDLGPTIPWKKQFKAWCWSLGILLVAGTIAGVWWPTVVHGMQVLSQPGKFVPHVGKVKFLTVEPGNDGILAGQSISFTATIEAPDNRPIDDGRILIQYASGKKAEYPLTAYGTGNSHYRYELTSVAEGLNYYLKLGDSESERYRIEVIPEIHVTEYQVTTTPPKYTGREKSVIRLAGKDLSAQKGSLEAPAGSKIELTVLLDSRVNEVLLNPLSGSPIALAADSEHKTFEYSLLLGDTLLFGLNVNDGSQRTLHRFPDDQSTEAGGAGGDVSYFTYAVLPDSPPTINVKEPGRDLDAKPGDSVLLAATANDDYGLTEVCLETARGTDGPFAVSKRWEIKPGPDAKTPKQFLARHALELPAKDFKFGETLRYRFTVTDNRDLLALRSDWGTQKSLGQIYSINFNDTALAAAKSQKNWELLRQKLTLLLNQQLALHKTSSTLLTSPTLQDLHKLAQAQKDGQQILRTGIATLAKDFPFEPEMKLVQKSLQVLLTDDATNAIDKASDLLALGDLRPARPISLKFRQHQAHIIDTLQALLAIATNEATQPPQVLGKAGGDLPNEGKQAWQQLADDLKKFEKEQKQVIASTADLAKKPKDQLDQNDKDKITAAQALEDKWEKFLSQKIVDMSKLTEQDQANTSLLEELVQMKVEVAAAKDSLKLQATEIATPLEENALEGAQKLVTHIERWLSQQPDRIKWEMEELATQYEPPMAELPKQLQDMVGDLMDQEEDLTEEMESQGSKYNDSFDKGAGWDAVDGPISSTSAQGVTGNQMPKDMEIQGRSGEGREGRASGEMVGAEAEGKGGRRTPTRMTPEPFASGKVDDKSTDPAGGATGGGKKAGWGGEGLEGDSPNSAKDPMQRLAGKQAALRNEAERIEIQSRHAGFNNFKLLEAAVYMQRSETALKDGKYTNAMYYQRQSIQSLNTAKVLAAGEMHVTLDTSPTASTKQQKDIQDALNNAMPKGYSDQVKAYFERLNESSPPPDPQP